MNLLDLMDAIENADSHEKYLDLMEDHGDQIFDALRTRLEREASFRSGAVSRMVKDPAFPKCEAAVCIILHRIPTEESPSIDIDIVSTLTGEESLLVLQKTTEDAKTKLHLMAADQKGARH